MPSADPRPAGEDRDDVGGRSRRMGVPKAGVLLDGAGLRPVVVAKRTSELPAVPGLERWDEPDDPTHPLTGVVAALHRAAAPVVVLPVDLPHVPSALLAHLAARPEPLVIVEGAGRRHPLLARVAPEHAPALEAAARSGARVMETVEGLGAAVAGDDVVAPMGDPAVLLRNLNRPDDLANRAWTNG